MKRRFQKSEKKVQEVWKWFPCVTLRSTEPAFTYATRSKMSNVVPLVVLTNPSCEESELVSASSEDHVNNPRESTWNHRPKRMASTRVSPVIDPEAIETIEISATPTSDNNNMFSFPNEADSRRTSEVSVYQQQKRVRLSIPVEPINSGGGGNFRKDSLDAMMSDPEVRSQVLKRRSAVSGLSPNTSISIGAVM